MIALCPVLGYGKLSMHETYTVVAIVQLFLIDELIFFLLALRVVVVLFTTLNRVQQIYMLPDKKEQKEKGHVEQEEDESLSSY